MPDADGLDAVKRAHELRELGDVGRATNINFIFTLVRALKVCQRERKRAPWLRGVDLHAAGAGVDGGSGGGCRQGEEQGEQAARHRGERRRRAPAAAVRRLPIERALAGERASAIVCVRKQGGHGFIYAP